MSWEFQDLLYEIQRDHVAVITLNRPDARNAWSDEMLNAMFVALERANTDPNVRAVVVTGAGKSFCAGGDLKAMRDRAGMFSGDTVGLRRQYSSGLQRVTRLFEHLEKPVIAAINGAAIGAGLDLSLMCDIRIASNRAKFGSTFAAVGLIPGDGGAYLLTRAIGFSRAVELILSTRVIDSEEALRIGMVHELRDPEDVLEHAMTRAEAISKLPAPAVQMAKVALYRSYNQGPETALQLTAALQSIVQHTQAHTDAVDAMLEKIGKK